MAIRSGINNLPVSPVALHARTFGGISDGPYLRRAVSPMGRCRGLRLSAPLGASFRYWQFSARSTSLKPGRGDHGDRKTRLAGNRSCAVFSWHATMESQRRRGKRCWWKYLFSLSGEIGKLWGSDMFRIVVEDENVLAG